MVRRRARQADKKYRAIIGNPTPIMETLSKTVLYRAGKEYSQLMFNPSYHKPKIEPFKRYVYNKNGQSNDIIPYKTEWPTRPSRIVRRAMRKETV